MGVVTLSGASVMWIRENTAWGKPADGGTAAAQEARVLVLAAPSRKYGKHGFQVKVDLTAEQADALWLFLDMIASNGESMTAEERGDGAYEYRAMRRDADRMRED